MMGGLPTVGALGLGQLCGGPVVETRAVAPFPARQSFPASSGAPVSG
jgi:hypothetical protein